MLQAPAQYSYTQVKGTDTAALCIETRLPANCSAVCVMLSSKELALKTEHGTAATLDALHLQTLKCWKTSPRSGTKGQ